MPGTTGWLLDRIDGLGNTTHYTPDNMGKVTGVHYSIVGGVTATADEAYTYDVNERLSTMADGWTTTHFTYTPDGRLQGEYCQNYTDYTLVTNVWLTPWARQSVAAQKPDGSGLMTVSYGYDQAHRLRTVTDSGGTYTYSYSGGSLPPGARSPSGLALANALTIAYGYDNVARLTSTVFKNGGGTLNSHAYQYNVSGQRFQQTRTLGDTVNYTYDAIGQLKTAVGKEANNATRWNEQLNYTYDPAGNLTQRVEDGLTEVMTANNLNQFSSLSAAGTATVAGSVQGATVTSVSIGGTSGSLYADGTYAVRGQPVQRAYTVNAYDNGGQYNTATVTLAATSASPPPPPPPPPATPPPPPPSEQVSGLTLDISLSISRARPRAGWTHCSSRPTTGVALSASR